VSTWLKSTDLIRFIDVFKTLGVDFIFTPNVVLVVAEIIGSIELTGAEE
jgi:hypothetical protein